MTNLTHDASYRQVLAEIKQRIRHAQTRAVMAVNAELIRDMAKSMGVSGFELTRALPQTMQSSLPSIEDIKEELKGGEA